MSDSLPPEFRGGLMLRDWRNGGPVDSTLKARIGPMLKRIDEHMKEAGN